MGPPSSGDRLAGPAAIDPPRPAPTIRAVTRLVVPPTLHRYRVPAGVVRETEAFLSERGRFGVEGTCVWLGRVTGEVEATIDSLYVPEQIAYRTDSGLAVTVTRAGLQGLTTSLEPGTFVLARVHSHGGEPYHSDTDDANMLVSHQGAISIVVPNLAREPIELTECSVNELRHGAGWIELSPREVAARFEVIP